MNKLEATMYHELCANLEMMRRMQWGGDHEGFRYCLDCEKFESDGHAPNCALDARIKSTESVLSEARGEE